MILLAAALLLTAGSAHAESGRTLPNGSQTLYGGVAVNTFRTLRFADGEAGDDSVLDRALRVRLDLYYARAFSDRFQLAAFAPVFRSWVPESAFDNGDHGPCPSSPFCDPVTSVGSSGLQGRYHLVSSPLDLTGGLAVATDIWNSSVRGQYTAMGDGTVDVQPSVYLGKTLQAGAVGVDVVGWGSYTWRPVGHTIDYGPAGEFRAPGDDVRAGAEIHLRPTDRLGVEVGAQHVRRLWGVDWEKDYVKEYWTGKDDRWTVLWYRHTAVTGKVSVALPENMGVHFSVLRVVDVRNGPPDTWDIGVGVHRWIP